MISSNISSKAQSTKMQSNGSGDIRDSTQKDNMIQHWKSYMKKCALVDSSVKCYESSSERQLHLSEEEFKVLLEKYSFKLHRHGTPLQKLSQLFSLLKSNPMLLLETLEDLMTIICLVIHEYMKGEYGVASPLANDGVEYSQKVDELNFRLEDVVRRIISLKANMLRSRSVGKEKKNQFTRDHIQYLNVLIFRFSAVREKLRSANATTGESVDTVADLDRDSGLASLPSWCCIDLSSTDLDLVNLSHMNLRFCVFGKDLGRVDFRNSTLASEQLRCVRSLARVQLDQQLAAALRRERYQLAIDMLERVGMQWIYNLQADAN